MAEVLAAHREIPNPTLHRLCACGWLGKLVMSGSIAELTAHQAEQLAANGYGKLEDAWDEGATATTGHHDTGYPITNPYRRPE